MTARRPSAELPQRTTEERLDQFLFNLDREQAERLATLLDNPPPPPRSFAR